MKNWDVIIIGGGIIGLSLSLELRKNGATVLIVERGEPGREASYAAGGMLVDCSIETAPGLQALATASARMYPEFAHELEVESGMKVDLREQGTLLTLSAKHIRHPEFTAAGLSPADLSELEPAMVKLTLDQEFDLKERGIEPRMRSRLLTKFRTSIVSKNAASIPARSLPPPSKLRNIARSIFPRAIQ